MSMGLSLAATHYEQHQQTTNNSELSALAYHRLLSLSQSSSLSSEVLSRQWVSSLEAEVKDRFSGEGSSLLEASPVRGWWGHEE
jgi:hypothetical protein